MKRVQIREIDAHHDRRHVGGQVAGVDPAERFRDRPESRHRERRAGGRQDRRLGRGRGRGQHRDDQQLVERGAEDVVAQRAEHVFGVAGQEMGAVERLRRCGDDDVDQHQQDRAHHGRLAWAVGGVARLLIDADAAVPSPVDEDAEQHPADQRRAAPRQPEGREPVEADMDGAGHAGHVDLPQRDRREQAQREDLDRQEDELGAGRDLDPDVADPGHQHDPDRGDDAHVEEVFRGRGEAEERKCVDAGDVGQGRHHHDVGGDDHPAGQPAEVGPQRPRHPGKAGPAVGVRLVHIVVGGGDQEHRDEGDDHHRRCVEAHPGHSRDEAQRRRDAVGGSGRGDPDDEVGDVADRPGFQPLAALPGPSRFGDVPGGDRSALHVTPPCRPLRSRRRLAATLRPRRRGMQVANDPKAGAAFIRSVQGRLSDLTQ